MRFGRTSEGDPIELPNDQFVPLGFDGDVRYVRLAKLEEIVDEARARREALVNDARPRWETYRNCDGDEVAMPAALVEKRREPLIVSKFTTPGPTGPVECVVETLSVHGVGSHHRKCARLRALARGEP